MSVSRFRWGKREVVNKSKKEKKEKKKDKKLEPEKYVGSGCERSWI